MTHRPDRRNALRFGLTAASAACLPFAARAQAPFPNHPVKVLIGTPAGDTADGWTRALVELMARDLGQPFIVENRPGAHGMIVAAAARSAAPDGYTLLAATGGPMAINPGLYGERLKYDPVKDFVPIAPVLRGPLYLYCNNDVPVRTVREMVAWVRARPGRVSYGSGGAGTTQHLTMELLKRATGLEMTHVPYRGSPMVLADVIGGQIPFAFDAGGSLLPQARSGKVRLLAVTSAQRDPAMPNVPTFAEQGYPGLEVGVWMGFFAPAGTPANVVGRLNAAIGKAVATPDFVRLLAASASEPWTGSPDDLRRSLAADIQRWSAIVREAGIQAD